jgi:hypothetical protein
VDKAKFEKLIEMMKSCCTSEESMANCRSMMRKMMPCGQGEEKGKKKKDAEEKE